MNSGPSILLLPRMLARPQLCNRGPLSPMHPACRLTSDIEVLIMNLLLVWLRGRVWAMGGSRDKSASQGHVTVQRA
jgi:hypothetical protein